VRRMIVDVNPFVYSRPVAPEDVVDREDEVRRLLRNAVGGHYVRLYAPRKYGKTSLLKRALHAHRRRVAVLSAVSVAMSGLAIVAAIAAWIARVESQPGFVNDLARFP